MSIPGKPERKSDKERCAICGKNTKGCSDKCVNCASVFRRKVSRPPLDVVEGEICRVGYWHAAKQFGVSDVALRKWFRSVGRQPPPAKYRNKISAPVE